MTEEISCYISPHGFGHATRTIAVLEALHEQLPDLTARIFTTVPESLFLGCPMSITYHRVVTDVGVVQKSPFSINAASTLTRLGAFFPLSETVVQQCAALSRSSVLLLCDISPLGIAVGKRTGIPSLLIENFTWDWIYRPLAREFSLFNRYAEMFTAYYNQADLRVQIEPVCLPTETANQTCPPIARRRRRKRSEVTDWLDTGGRPSVLISMGGFPFDPPFLDLLAQHSDIFFVIAGQPRDEMHTPNIKLLSTTSPMAHPDLINGVDLLICKCGYSTVAECAQTMTPICCVARMDFAESAILANYVVTHLGGTVIEPEPFFAGNWVDNLPRIMTTPVQWRPQNPGSRSLAEWIRTLLV